MKSKAKTKRARTCAPETALSLEMESLENRQMLAGNVSAVITGAGNLVVTGDGAANEIDVAIDSTGQVSITGNAGTTVDIGNLATAQVSGDVRINLGGGDDVVSLYGVDSSAPIRNVSINTGTGDDSAIVGYLYGSIRPAVMTWLA
jgi:hypothetical protein